MRWEWAPRQRRGPCPCRTPQPREPSRLSRRPPGWPHWQGPSGGPLSAPPPWPPWSPVSGPRACCFSFPGSCRGGCGPLPGPVLREVSGRLCRRGATLRSLHPGQVRAPTPQGSDLAVAAPQPHDHARREQAVGGSSGPPEPQPGPGCSEPVLQDGFRLGLGLWPGRAGRWPRCWSLGPGAPPPHPAQRLLEPQGERAPPVPAAATGAGTPTWWALAPVGGSARGQASAPRASLAGGAVAAGVSGWPWCPRSGCSPLRWHVPTAATRQVDPGGSAGGAGGRPLRGATAPGSLPRGVWSSAPCPARLPAVGHGAQSWLERQSQPGQARLRQGLQTGQPEGSPLTAAGTPAASSAWGGGEG